MFSHKLPNGNIIRSDNLPRELAIKRMIDEERWMQEHREELEVSSQQLFDDMFGGCLLYTSPSPRDATLSRMPSSA